MKTLITGGVGAVGYFLAKNLADQEQEVIIVDNLIRGELDQEMRSLLKKPNVSLIKADIIDRRQVEKLPRDCDYVYHLAMINATRIFYERPVDILRVGVLGTFNILEWFKNNKKGKILFTSSNELYASWIKLTGNPLPTPELVPLCIEDSSNPRWSYAGSKIIGEIAFFNYAKTFGFPMSIVRYHNSYGPRMGFGHVIPDFILRILKKEEPFKIFGAENTRAFCYVTDTVRASQLVMESEKTNGKIIHIGNDKEEISMLNLAKRMFELFNYQPKKVEIHSAPNGSVLRRCPDLTKIRKLTGHEPSVDLNEGLKRSWDWYKGNLTKIKT